MLSIYQHQTQVTVTVDYPTDNGATIVPNAVTYKVKDEEGVILDEGTAAPPSDELGSQLTLMIDPQHNMVPDGAMRAARAVVFEFSTDGGTYVATSRYVIEKASLLEVMTNTFMTYEQAVLTRLEVTAAEGWDGMDEQAQVAALVTAHDRMCRLTYRYKLSQDAVMYDSADPYWVVDSMRLRTMADYEKWPKEFKRALHRAQLFEANHALMGDPVSDKRRMGVISESIGESKMFFNAKPPLRLPLCLAATETLAPYLYSSRRIGRA